MRTTPPEPGSGSLRDHAPRKLVYDAKLWGGRDKGDNSQFYKPAVILNEYVDSEGRLLADVRFDHDGRTSRGHFVDVMRDV